MVKNLSERKTIIYKKIGIIYIKVIDSIIAIKILKN